MTNLDKMTAAELVAEEKSLVSALQMGAMGIGNANLSTIAKHKAITAELDHRCTKAGLSRNPNGTYRMPEFEGNVEEMAERLALWKYLLSKSKP